MSATEDNPELVAIVKKLAAALEKTDAALAQAQFTDAAWNRSIDPGQGFYQQGIRKRFELRLLATQEKGDRAVVSVDIAVSGKLVDRVYFYVTRQKGTWRIDGIDENRGHHEPFLSGQVPAAFFVEELPDSKQLLALGNLFTDAANDKAGALDKLYAQVVDTSSVGYLNLRELRGATCKAAYFSEPLGKLALAFERPATLENPSPERIFLYLQHQPPMWHIYSKSYGSPSARSMLHETKFFLKDPSATAGGGR